jgi:hypothetical protein
MEVPSEIDLVGIWIIKSAEFQEEVDLDGDGPMLPMKDIKDFLLGLFDVYASCSSLDEIPIEFSDDIATPATSENPTNKYSVYAVCPAGQGVTSQIAVYYTDPYSADGFYLEIEELNDPGNLIEWGGSMYIIITEQSSSGGIRSMHGRGSLIPNGSTRYEHFDFVLEEYTGG